MINFQVVLLYAKYRNTSEEQLVLPTSLDDNFKALTLSDMIVAGKHLLLANLHNVVKIVHIKFFSKLEVHSLGRDASKQTDIFLYTLSFPISPLFPLS